MQSEDELLLNYFTFVWDVATMPWRCMLCPDGSAMCPDGRKNLLAHLKNHHGLVPQSPPLLAVGSLFMGSSETPWTDASSEDERGSENVKEKSVVVKEESSVVVKEDSVVVKEEEESVVVDEERWTTEEDSMPAFFRRNPRCP